MGATDNKVSYMKLYRERNRERLNKYQAKYQKLYYEKNHEKFSQEINCLCGGHFKKKNQYLHERSKKHINFCVKNGYKHFEWVEKSGKDILDTNDLNKIHEYINAECP